MNKIVFVSGKDYSKMVDGCLMLDKSVYELKYVGRKEFYDKAHQSRPENFIFAIDVSNGKLAGYILATPISKDIYEKMRTGNFIDTELIKSNDILNLSEIEDNYMYIYSLVVSPGYQGSGISKDLVSEFFESIDNLDEDYKINSILADTINPKVFGNVSRYGFAPIEVTNHESVLMEKIYLKDDYIEMIG